MPLGNTNWPATTEVTDAVTEVLIRARAFVARGWCRAELALDADGEPVDPKSERAVEWCAAGAIFAAGWHRSAVCRLKAAIGGADIHEFNDQQETSATIIAAFDRAIAAGGGYRNDTDVVDG